MNQPVYQFQGKNYPQYIAQYQQRLQENKPKPLYTLAAVLLVIGIILLLYGVFFDNPDKMSAAALDLGSSQYAIAIIFCNSCTATEDGQLTSLVGDRYKGGFEDKMIANITGSEAHSLSQNSWVRYVDILES